MHSFQKKRWSNKSRPALVIALVFVLGLLLSNDAFSADKRLNSFRFGLITGVASSAADIEADTSAAFNNDRGLGFAIGGVIEKPISNSFQLTAELHAISSYSYAVFGTSSESYGVMASFGGVLGAVNKKGSPYFAASIGLSRIDIGDNGRRSDNDDDCGVSFICFGNSFRRGGTFQGLGGRIAVGYTFPSLARVELAFARLGGEGQGSSSGRTGSLEVLSVGFRYLF